MLKILWVFREANFNQFSDTWVVQYFHQCNFSQYTLTVSLVRKDVIYALDGNCFARLELDCLRNLAVTSLANQLF